MFSSPNSLYAVIFSIFLKFLIIFLHLHPVHLYYFAQKRIFFSIKIVDKNIYFGRDDSILINV